MADGKKWHLVIDVARCSDCNNCFLADKDEFVGNDWPPYSVAQPWTGQRWIDIRRKERGRFPKVDVAHLPVPCMHCDDPPCAQGAPQGAVYKRPDGIVIIDPVKAKGHRELVDACPYGAIYWNEEAAVAQKCTGCAHLLDEGWTQTRCSQVCPTEALRLVLADESQIAEMVKNEGLQPYRPELGTRPRVYYKNLHRWTKAFLAGSVVFADSGECAKGARVALFRNGDIVRESETNEYGDFKFDGLEPGNGYGLRVQAAGYLPLAQPVEVAESSTVLPDLFLERR
jgi:Fe-S-cluster-containing dehydrogenase component